LVHPCRLAGAPANPGQRPHELDQRRLDRSRKAPIELIEGAFADDFAEEVTAALLGAFTSAASCSTFCRASIRVSCASAAA